MHKKIVSVPEVQRTVGKLTRRWLPYSEARQIVTQLRRKQPVTAAGVRFLPLDGGNVYGAYAL